LPQAQAHVTAGKFGTPKVMLEVATPRREAIVGIYAAAHLLSGNPLRPELRFHIEYAADAGKTWKPVVKDWDIPRRGQEPNDFWSQSCCWGSALLPAKDLTSVQVRFHNNGGKSVARAEVHLIRRAGWNTKRSGDGANLDRNRQRSLVRIRQGPSGAVI
jgi:hypothetical protein